MQIYRCKKLPVFFTCAVYGDNTPYAKETSKKNPKGVYGFTKLKCEQMVKKNFVGKNKNYGILRYFNVVGASPSKKIGQINKNGQLFKNFSIAIKKEKPVFNIYGKNYKTFDGTCVRDYIHVYDVAGIHIKVLLKMNRTSQPIILNCGYGIGLSVLEIANAFKKFSKNKVQINFKKKKKRRNGKNGCRYKKNKKKT